MTIAIGSDHAGFELKEYVLKYLKEQDYQVEDFGTFVADRVDYPDYAIKVAHSVASGENQFGIVICGTGLGVSITANKVRGIRAALCCSEYMAEMARRHNNANILALGGRTTSQEQAIKIIDTFFATEFEGGRHATRVDKIHSLTGK